MPEPSKKHDTFEAFQHWVNLDFFAARLLGTDLTKWTHSALWSMRDALEQSQDPTRDALEGRISAATQWIEQAGLKLFKKLSNRELNEWESKALAGGPLHDGRPGLSSER